MSTKNAICLITDRLHAGFLGAYGNTWMQTPHFDQLASESILFDAATIDSPNLEQLYRSYWLGQHALEPNRAESKQHESEQTLIARLAASGVRSVLLTDDTQIIAHPLAEAFDECIALPMRDEAVVADSMDETHFADFFTQAIDLLEQFQEPTLLWLHCQGMAAAWDAPLEMRCEYAAEEDPPPPTGAEVPSLRLEDDYDPDQLLGISQAYAGQVTLWDACLGALLEALDSSPLASNTLLSVLSARGFPLGEHLDVGPIADALYGELVQVPWLIRLPNGQARAIRSRDLVQPADLYTTLLDWWEIAPQPTYSSATGQSLLDLCDPNALWRRDRGCTQDASQWSLLTSAWFMRRCEEDGLECHQLFTKPDDRFELNEIASRCPEVVDKMEQAFQEFRLLAQSVPPNVTESLGALDPLLLEGRR